MNKIFWGVWGIAVGVLSTVILLSFFLVPKPELEVKQPKECQTFAANVFDPMGLVIIGDISLCGYDLEWTNVEGPYDGLPPLKGIEKPEEERSLGAL